MPLTRSEQMARIKSADTTPEILLRRALFGVGIRYRLHVRTPGGRADVAIASKQFAVFVDGCFWHGCPDHYVRPRTSNPFWDKKLRENVDRDRRQTLALLDQGWHFVRVWEHALVEDAGAVAREVMSVLTGSVPWSAPKWRVGCVQFLDAEGVRELRHLEALTDPAEKRTEEGRRSTAKTGRVRRAPATVKTAR